MPSFSIPSPAYNYNLSTETAAVDDWYAHRQVPLSQAGRLLLASWNVANLGEQKRSEKDLKLIAHMMQRFDLIAVQEVKSRLDHFQRVVAFMGPEFDYILNDSGGNSERLAYVYRKNRVTLGRLFGEVAIPQKDYPSLDVVVKYKRYSETRVEVYYKHPYTAFDRNPFIGTFTSGLLDFTVANVHLYFGAFKNSSSVAERAKYARRVLEIFALASWAKKRHKGTTSYDNDVILVGDMNVPAMDEDDAAFRALKRSGLKTLDYFTKTGGSNLAGSKTYDQLAIAPGDVEDRMLQFNVIDFDSGIFKNKWTELNHSLSAKKALTKFNQYIRFHVSDHRIIWMELKTD